MSDAVLFYLGGAIPIVWGLAHLFPTRSVVSGFGDLSDANRRIITMEWLTEGVALVALGGIVCLVTAIDPESAVSQAVYWSVVLALNTLSVISGFTGARIDFLPFRLCPVVFTGSSLLLVIALLTPA